MRLFVAADISDDTREQLRHLRAQLESTLASARHPPRISWSKPENAHVTLRFIGQVDEKAVSGIKAALTPDVAIPTFDVDWDHAGTFPGGRWPRVIWIGASRGGDMARVAREVTARLDPLIGPGETRPFTAHITLGRVKDPGRGIDWRAAIAGMSMTSTRSRIDHVTLYESRLSPKGSTYTPLVVTRLA